MLKLKSYHSADHFLRDADRAMYHAKAFGTRHHVFDPVLHSLTMTRSQLESDLKTGADSSTAAMVMVKNSVLSID